MARTKQTEERKMMLSQRTRFDKALKAFNDELPADMATMKGQVFLNANMKEFRKNPSAANYLEAKGWVNNFIVLDETSVKQELVYSMMAYQEVWYDDFAQQCDRGR